MSTKDKYVWYIEPKSKDIDWSITLGITAAGGGDTTAHMVGCDDGRRRNLIECSKEMCEMVAKSYKIGIDFNIWRKNSRDAKIQRDRKSVV